MNENRHEYEKCDLHEHEEMKSFREEDVRSDFAEETAAEIAAPVRPIGAERVHEHHEVEEEVQHGRAYGYTALALSILSLFIIPVLFGAAGIVVGFVARRKGAHALGSWAIGIGALSIIIGLFILPFF
nr:YybS family protein [Mangrovibacillus cuniculi]